MSSSSAIPRSTGVRKAEINKTNHLSTWNKSGTTLLPVDPKKYAPDVP
jgi:hypothetical protein